MSYNLVGIRTRVANDKLDDTEFDSSVIDNFINDTQRDIFNEYELPFQEKIFNGTIQAGSTMFKMPDDLSELQYQTMSDVPNFSNNKMKWQAFFDKFNDNANAEPGKPEYWTLYAGNMIFNRPTDKDYVVTMYYIMKPQTLVGDADVPQLPPEFEELLVLGAFKRVQERNEDYDLSAITNQEYNNQLDLLVSRYGYRETGPIKMKNMQNKPIRR